MHAELAQRGHDCCVDTVARIMRNAGIAAKTKRKFRRNTDSNHKLPVADILLDRHVDPTSKKSHGSPTLPTSRFARAGSYLAAVEDLFSRMLVDWSMGATMTSRLVVNALPDGGPPSPPRLRFARPLRSRQSVCQRELPTSPGLRRHHLQHESTWQLLGQRADESFFATLQKDLVHHEDYLTRAQARTCIFEYIETCYIRSRRNSTSDYQSPADFEAAHTQ
jgi:transposase InsO family protein